MSFSESLLDWYHQNRRDLPWRKTSDPYLIWVSEVILQQTRVDQGLPYYERFISLFPDVQSLAKATEEEVLKVWQGLGYYSRARNMHQTARQVQSAHQGKFPSAFSQLIALKGIGPYTAAAVASLSANEPHAVVDGNVSRVLSRFFGVDTPINSHAGKKLFQELADANLPPGKAADYNQAIMEFGALHCKPRNPLCPSCPLAVLCIARIDNRQHELPVKLKKTKVTDRYFAYFLAASAAGIWMQKRSGNDIWTNLWQLPLIEVSSAEELENMPAHPQVKTLFGSVEPVGQPVRHLLSHQRLHCRFFKVKNDLEQLPYQFVPVDQLQNLPMPKVIFAFLQNYG